MLVQIWALSGERMLQHLPEVEFGTTDSFMLTLDGKPRLVRLVPWSLRERGFGVGGDPLGLVDRRERSARHR